MSRLRKQLSFGRFIVAAILLIVATLLFFWAAQVLRDVSLGIGSEQEAQARLHIVTTIAQIGEPMTQIVGDQARVTILMGPGSDPHLYRPTRSDILALAHADLVLWNGLHLEAQMADAIQRQGTEIPHLPIGETLDPALLLRTEDDLFDPHIWMDPMLWNQALHAATEKLAELDPDHAAIYRANAARYLADFAALDAEIRTQINTIPSDRRVMVTAHDAFGYLGRRYEMEVLGVQGISTESEAGLRQIESLVATLVEQRIPAVFVESSVSNRNVLALIEGAAARGHVVRLGGELYSDAMGDPGSGAETYIGMMRQNVAVISAALSSPSEEVQQ